MSAGQCHWTEMQCDHTFRLPPSVDVGTKFTFTEPWSVARKSKCDNTTVLLYLILLETLHQNPLLSWSSSLPPPAGQIQEHDSLRPDDHRRPERHFPRNKAGQRETSLLAAQTHCWTVNVPPWPCSRSCIFHWGKPVQYVYKSRVSSIREFRKWLKCSLFVFSHCKNCMNGGKKIKWNVTFVLFLLK